jgi:hypothetical protein
LLAVSKSWQALIFGFVGVDVGVAVSDDVVVTDDVVVGVADPQPVSTTVKATEATTEMARFLMSFINSPRRSAVCGGRCRAAGGKLACGMP